MAFVSLAGEVTERGGSGVNTVEEVQGDFCRQGDAAPIAAELWQLI